MVALGALLLLSHRVERSDTAAACCSARLRGSCSEYPT